MAISTGEPVRTDWKISDVLARYPQLLQVLIDLSPAFGHLRNPLARTLRTRLVSVGQAARVAGMQPTELVRHLNEAAGLENPTGEDVSEQTEPTQQATDDPAITEELDVRPLLERGEEPFKLIMEAVGRIPEGGALRLRTTFEPVPLYEVMARRGFSHFSRQFTPDDWEVVFSRQQPSEVPAPRCARSQCQPPVEASDSKGIVHLDVSDLVPPEPMVRILEAAAKLGEGETLLVEHHRRPVYLYPQLETQGYAHETTELGPGRVQIRIRRA
jgi:uncharacterized protein (DUF2249 family)